MSAPAVEAAAPAFAAAPDESLLAAQSMLFALGYDPVPIDGKAGILTTQAIQRYQRDQGLPPDGAVTRALVESLAKSVRQTRFAD